MEYERSRRDEAQILALKLKLLLHQSTVAFLANFINSLFFLFFAWREPIQRVVLVWTATLNLITLLRYSLNRRLAKREAEDIAKLKRRHAVFVAGVGVSGAYWGMMGWFYFASDSPITQSFALFLMAGMVSGAGTAYSSSLPAFYSFALPALVPFILLSFYFDGVEHAAMAVVSITYLGLMVLLAKNANRATLETIRLTLQNEYLRAERRASSRLLANVSHEIRTPLTAIQGYADLLLEDANRFPKERESASIIKKSSEHLLALVDDLLDISGLRAGESQFHFSWFSPSGELNELVQLLGPKNIKKIPITVRELTPMPEKIYSDAKVFRQIVINLVNNALKFTPQGGIDITMSVEPDGERPLLVVDVADTGIGIRPDFIDRLFQPFAKGSESPLPGQRGAGLGLALSKDLARAMGGDLILKQTAVGVGTTFTFFIDSGYDRTTGLAAQPGEKTAEEKRRNWSARLQNSSMLVVDDSPEIASLIRRILEKHGVSVDLATSGRDAVELVKNKTYDVVLLDLGMPDLDGFETARRIRARGYVNPILALTADNSEDSRRRSLQAGFNGFLHKPLSNEQLLDALATWRRSRPPPKEPPSANP